jgi:hypothetical protein
MSNLNFLASGCSASGLTSIWEVRSAHTDILLGNIAWYAPWRRYTYQDKGQNIYDATCFREIADFLDTQMEARKQKS